jgi:hypothetical protein
MKVETLGEVIHWAREYHQVLGDCLQHCSEHALIERGQMLLQYLADHETRLSDVLQGFEQSGDTKALNTWCYDYLEHYPIEPHSDCDRPFAELSTHQIMQRLEQEHSQIIALYKHLRERVEAPSATELVDQLISLEVHEAMRASQSANRLEDL